MRPDVNNEGKGRWSQLPWGARQGAYCCPEEKEEQGTGLTIGVGGCINAESEGCWVGRVCVCCWLCGWGAGGWGAVGGPKVG